MANCISIIFNTCINIKKVHQKETATTEIHFGTLSTPTKNNVYMNHVWDEKKNKQTENCVELNKNKLLKRGTKIVISMRKQRIATKNIEPTTKETKLLFYKKKKILNTEQQTQDCTIFVEHKQTINHFGLTSRRSKRSILIEGKQIYEST